MIELKAPMSIKNEYVLELYDKDGKLKDKAYAYNLVTNSFWKRAFDTSSDWYPFSWLYIGTGTGTPSTSDTDLFRRLVGVEATRTDVKYAYPTSTATYKATFAASSSAIGVITEVGFNTRNFTYSSALQTHAMLQDSEGNPITINKTDTDTLIVTAKVHCTVSASDDLSLVSAGSFIGFTCTFYSSSNSLKPDAYRLLASPYSPLYSYLIVNNNTASASSSTRSFTSSTSRINKDTGNGCYVNAVYVDGFGKVQLPNESIFPAYELQPMLVGTGDGSTTEFKCPIPDFVENTETITVDGVELTRDVDYTVDPTGNTALNASAITAYSNFAKSVTGFDTSNYTGAYYYFGLRAMRTNTRYNRIGTSSSPLIFDLGQEKACNALFIDSLVTCYSSPSSPVSCTVTLDYSLDGSTWQTACSVNSQCARYNSLSNIPSNYKNILTKFNPVTARYWRLYASSTDYYVNAAGLGSGGGNSFFGYVGDGIVFKEPPAEGAEIKIKATVNRPYKTSDYLIDWSASVYF